MNYLQLAQRLRQELDLSGTGPEAVTGQTGQLQNVVTWTDAAWQAIQNMHGGRWRWLRGTFTLATVADDDTYAYGDATDDSTGSAIMRFNAWRLSDRLNPPKIYLASAGVGTQKWLRYIGWDRFNAIYKIGSPASGYPSHITVDPNDNLVLGPKPNGIYTVQGEFWRGPQTLSANADEPECPSQFHLAIVWYALKYYGYQQASPEALAQADAMLDDTLGPLELNQAEAMRWRKAGALA